jgi:hypothetical protein
MLINKELLTKDSLQYLHEQTVIKSMNELHILTIFKLACLASSKFDPTSTKYVDG